MGEFGMEQHYRYSPFSKIIITVCQTISYTTAMRQKWITLASPKPQAYTAIPAIPWMDSKTDSSSSFMSIHLTLKRSCKTWESYHLINVSKVQISNITTFQESLGNSYKNWAIIYFNNRMTVTLLSWELLHFLNSYMYLMLSFLPYKILFNVTYTHKRIVWISTLIQPQIFTIIANSCRSRRELRE